MDLFEKKIYDDFYVAYFDSAGNITYPSDLEEVNTIKQLLANASSNNLVFIEDRNLFYKVRVKRKIVDGNKVQIVELSNVTEFFNQISTASVDEITHLGNRKIARNLFMQYIEIANQKAEDFSIMMVDLDGFKKVNDEFGHTNGDIVLSEVSRILFCSTRQERNRQQDIVARIGGDEFIVILKNVPEAIAQERAEKIRLGVEQKKVALFSESNVVQYINTGTLSIGLYHVSHNELSELYNKGYTTDEIRQVLLDRSDSALYSSKNNGKNQITIYSKGKVRKMG